MKNVTAVLSEDLTQCIVLDEKSMHIHYVITLAQKMAYSNKFTYDRPVPSDSLISTFSFLTYYNANQWPLKRIGSGVFSIQFGEAEDALTYIVEGADRGAFKEIFSTAVSNVFDDSCNHPMVEVLANFDSTTDISNFVAFCVYFKRKMKFGGVVPLLMPVVRYRIPVLNNLLDVDDADDLFGKLKDFIGAFVDTDTWTLADLHDPNESDIGELLPSFGSFANTKALLGRIELIDEPFVEA